MENEEIKKLILEARETTGINRLATIGVELSSWYATLSESYLILEESRAELWMQLRKEDCKSDTMADRKYALTEQGKQWNRLRIQLKYIEKVVSSIKLKINIKNNEAHGLY